MPVAAVYRSPPNVSSKNNIKEPTTARDPLDTHTTNLSLTLADQTLTQLPFYPFGDCRLAGYTLPPKPDRLCESCWDGPFGAHAAWLFDVTDGGQHSSTSLPAASNSYSYWTTEQEIWSRNQLGCAWCRLLWQIPRFQDPGIIDVPFDKPIPIDIEVGLCFDGGPPPGGIHMIRVRLCGGQLNMRYAYTLRDGETERVYVPIIVTSELIRRPNYQIIPPRGIR